MIREVFYNTCLIKCNPMKRQNLTWNRFPLFKLLIPFMGGIISGIYETFGFSVPFSLGITVFLLLLMFIAGKLNNFRSRWVLGLFSIVLIYWLGYSLVSVEKQNHRMQDTSFPEDKDQWIVKSLGTPVEKENSYKLSVKLLRSDSTDFPDKRTILYFEKDSLLASNIDYGIRLIVHTRWQRPSKPTNPDQFNYRQYLARRGITHQSYAKAKNIKILNKKPEIGLRGWIFNLREQLLANFREHGLKGDEYTLASSILLGKDNSMDPRLRSGFATAGAMHILCVSGLHVGVIFLILGQLLKFLNRRKYGIKIKALLLILMIWFYAALTGLEPSVLRASTMISFIVIGRTIRRPTSVYNSLAASAFLLLIINPMIITQIGFQLSYMAVLAIVSFQPIFYRLWLPRNKWLDKIWAIITVSIAAQIGTFALAIHYFHIFPVYFLITNLIVIPLSSFIIYAGFLTFMTIPLVPVSWLFTKVLFGLLWFLKNSVFVIEELPMASLEYIHLNPTQIILLMLCFIFIYLWWITADRKPVFYALSAFLILMVSFLTQRIENHSNREFIFYNAGKGLAMEAVAGTNHTVIADSTVYNDDKFIQYNMSEHWVKKGLKKAEIRLLENNKELNKSYLIKRNNIICWQDTLIYVMKKHNKLLTVAPDILVVHNQKAEPETTLKNKKPDRIVLTEKIAPWNMKKWETYGKKQDIPLNKLSEGYLCLN